MDYDYDVFISYRRRDKWPFWVEEHLVPLLKRYLNEELDWDVGIFFDRDLEKTNVSWPNALAKRLAHSAILIPLWSKSYFRSPWSGAEFAHMRYRKRECGFRTSENEIGLISPAIVHNGTENLPEDARMIEAVMLQEYALANLQPNTNDALELEKLIRDWAPQIALAVESAPPRKDSWEKPLAEEFVATFYRHSRRQRRPSWSGK